MTAPVGARIANKYPGECRTCRKPVQVAQGWAVRGRRGWTVYCTRHVPPLGQACHDEAEAGLAADVVYR